MFFLLFYLDDRRIWIWIYLRIREAQKHKDPTDPDSYPQHCIIQMRRQPYSFSIQSQNDAVARRPNDNLRSENHCINYLEAV